ncbi:MAG: chloride channel protein [Bryobacteraceae bacterium]
MRLSGTGRLVGATLSAGVLAGLGAVGFHFLADSFGDELFSFANAHSLDARLPVVLLVPTIGLFFIGLFLQRFPESRYGGVREVLESLQHNMGRVPMVRILNVIMSGLVLAVGGSVGPEGPMVQLGALAGSQCGQFFRVSKGQLLTLTRAGASAGIAAAFRSPAGGVLLTLEVFGARFNSDLTAIAIASGIGYLVRTSILGDAYPFRPAVVPDPLPTSTLLLIIPLMGAVAAVAGHFFIWLFGRWKSVFPGAWPLWLRVTVGGALVGFIGIWYPQVLSAGYRTIDAGLTGGITLQLFVILLFLKMLATSITFGSGAVGGLFAPTLVIGSLFGGAFGYGVRAVFPSAVPQPELFVLLGMIVMFGSIIKGYWSGLLMIADLSGCYHQLLLPGVIAGGISYLISWELHEKSIFGLPMDPNANLKHETGG